MSKKEDKKINWPIYFIGSYTVEILLAMIPVAIGLYLHSGPEYPATCNESKSSMLEVYELDLKNKGVMFKNIDLIKLKETNYENSGIRSCKGILTITYLDGGKEKLDKEFKVTRNALTAIERTGNE